MCACTVHFSYTSQFRAIITTYFSARECAIWIFMSHITAVHVDFRYTLDLMYSACKHALHLYIRSTYQCLKRVENNDEAICVKNRTPIRKLTQTHKTKLRQKRENVFNCRKPAINNVNSCYVCCSCPQTLNYINHIEPLDKRPHETISQFVFHARVWWIESSLKFMSIAPRAAFIRGFIAAHFCARREL